MHETIAYERISGAFLFVSADLYATDPHRTRIHRLRVLSGRDRHACGGPAWSPDGTRLAFVRFGEPWPGSADRDLLCTSRLDSSPPKVIASGAPRAPAWSPDGTKIAYGDGSGLYAVNGDGTSRTLVWRAGAEEADLRATSPTWSPDGGRIAFSLKEPVTDGPSEPPSSPTLLVVDTDGGRARRIGPPGAQNPDWSPDGSRIAFDAYPENDRNRGRELFLIDPRGHNVSQLTDLPDSDAEAPAWSPDGHNLAFARRFSPPQGLFVLFPEPRSCSRSAPTEATFINWLWAGRPSIGA
jgi:TolB protein